MMRWMSAVVAAMLSATAGCSLLTSTTKDLPPESFAGSWRSETPSLEFIRLSVTTKPNEPGALAVRLTFSGIAWEGSGRIEGDSMTSNMVIAGSSTSSGDIVMRASNDQTLRVRVRPAPVSSMPVMDLTLVRDP